MEIEFNSNAGHVTLRIRGEVDLSSSPRLRDTILERLAGADLDIDLSATNYIDSSGLATLVEGLKRSKKAGREFRLVDPSEAVLRVLRLARLDNLFTIVGENPSAAT